MIRPFALTAALLGLCSAQAARAGYVVTVVETIDFAGASAVQARGVNTAGQVVGYRTVAGVTEGFVRTGGVYEFFRVNDANTFALGINDAGTVVGGVATPLPGNDSFIRTAAGVVTTFQPLGNTNSGAIGINSAGAVVASGNAFGTGGFLRQPDGTVTAVDYPAGPGDTVFKTNATDVTDAGTLVGHAIGENGGALFGRGWFSTDGGATFTDIAAPGRPFTFAWAGNDAGLVVGDSSPAAGGVRTGFVYDTAAGTFTPFAVAGASWTVPTGINDDGLVVGFWRSAADNQVRGFVAQVTAVPEPASALLLAAGAALGVARRRRA
jgi:uncharacterized membrane protein